MKSAAEVIDHVRTLEAALAAVSVCHLPESVADWVIEVRNSTSGVGSEVERLLAPSMRPDRIVPPVGASVEVEFPGEFSTGKVTAVCPHCLAVTLDVEGGTFTAAAEDVRLQAGEQTLEAVEA